MFFIKRAALVIYLGAALLLLNQCYLSKQGVYLLRYQSRLQNIDDVLKNENLPQDERDMLVLTKEIKYYAVESIGLSDDENYTKYEEVHKVYLVHEVSACEKDCFTPYMWI